MFEFILFILFFIILVPAVWVLTYRRGVSGGVGKLMSHVRGLVFSAVTCGVLLIVFAVAIGVHSSDTTPNANAAAKVAAPAPAPETVDRPTADTSDESYARFARMYKDKHFDVLEAELDKRHPGALKIIPALGGKSNVADVLKSRGIRIGLNADVSCLPVIKLAKAPGCMLTVYLTRKPPAQQTDLSGVPAHWFMGLNETRFRPLDGWAQHVDQNDQMLDAGALFGYSDNR